MPNKKKLEELFLTFATPEEILAYKLKKQRETLSLLAKSNVEANQAKSVIEGELREELQSVKAMVETLLERPIPEIPEVKEETGEEIVQKVNELEITPEKQIDAKHIKNLPKVRQQQNVENWGGLQTGLWLNGELITNSKLTVSLTAPSDPALYDLWYDLN